MDADLDLFGHGSLLDFVLASLFFAIGEHEGFFSDTFTGEEVFE